MMMENLLNTTQAAQVARKHPRTIVAWIRKGLLPAMKMPGGRGPYLIDRRELEATMAKRSTPHRYEPQDTDKGSA